MEACLSLTDGAVEAQKTKMVGEHCTRDVLQQNDPNVTDLRV